MRLRFDKYFRAAVSFIALLLLLPTLPAQSVITGGLTGIVTDPSGSVIAGAGVNLKNQSTSEIQSATTGSNGAYQFTLLKPGIYVVSVSQTGFKQVTETVEVLLGQTALASVKLEVGATSETITVTEQGALLQTEDANISSNFDTNQIQNIPNPCGDITYVPQTAPGII